MIRLSCTNCRQVLTIDDAFAGGVCRCQHCGTIQTVPASAAGGAEVTAGGPNLGGARVGTNGGSLFGGSGAGHAVEGTGLDDLAGAVASSGLSSRRLTRPQTAGAAPGRPAPAPRGRGVAAFAAAGVVIVALLGVIAYLATRGTAPTPAAVDPTINRPGVPVTPTPAGPHFCSTPLAGDTVVYVLDCGFATQEIFPALKDATLKSVASLGSDRHFQIIFWPATGDDPVAYPATSPTYATKDNVDAARRALDDVSAFGQTDAKPALALALRQAPDMVVLATAKSWALDDAWAKDVLAARGSAAVRVDTFSLGPATAPADATPALKAVADRTGGTYAVVTNDDLKAAGD